MLQSIMIVHTLKMCSGDAGPEQSLILVVWLFVYFQRTSDSLNEGLPIKMAREKFQRK